MSWNTAVPAGTDAANKGDDVIREFKTDTQTALRGGDVDGTESKFPGSDPANPIYRYRGLKGSTGARPASGDYGMYFDESRNVLQRDNGASWDDIGTVIPAGTVMLFYQAAAPVGWTQVITQNDKAIRVVSAVGGGSGGTIGLSVGISHIVNNHTHTTPDTSHTHILSTVATTGGLNYAAANVVGNDADANALKSISAGGGETVHSKSANTNAAGSAGVTGLPSNSGTDTVALAYIDVILASKD